MNEQSIFIAALERAPAERRVLLDDVGVHNPELRQRVEKLLVSHAAAVSFMEQPAGFPAPTMDQPLPEKSGTQVGPYKLLQQIGEGGFGVVFMAEQQEPVRRMVALKIIKPGMDTKEIIARFESERQALALMDHSHIAKVLDAGATDSGRPYFVMELVKGVSITEFCDRNHMPAEARLKLFIDVCHAIQHAHHKGVIHRDIKPSNVMVTLHDGVPVVKVIDFGVAKATVAKLTERTLFTAFGQMIGTPAYMSPEQAEMSGLDIDTRSDIFSLGVLLYELLTGTTPLDVQRLRQAGYAEMQRLIREETAPRPSTRLSSLGDSATVFAGNRGTDPKQLARLLSGDLDCIVLKALEKDRNRRYGTPGNFAEDVERYLHREPIIARPPSTSYLLKKFVQRNRAVVLMVAVVSAALASGFTVAFWQAIRATEAQRQAVIEATAAREAEGIAKTALKAEAGARAQAQKQREITVAVKEFLELDLLAQADPLDGLRTGDQIAPAPGLKLTEAIDRAASNISRRFAGQPLVEASVRVAIGQIYWRRLLFREAQSHLEQACELCRSELERSSVGGIDELVLGGCADAFLDLAMLLMIQTASLSATIAEWLQATSRDGG